MHFPIIRILKKVTVLQLPHEKQTFMNQTLNFQHQKVTGVSETVNSTNTGDTALVGLSLLWDKAG